MWTSGVWSFRCSPLWLSVNSSRWTSSPQRTFQSWVLVPAKGRALCRLDLLWASWHTSTPGTFDWGSIFFSFFFFQSSFTVLWSRSWAELFNLPSAFYVSNKGILQSQKSVFTYNGKLKNIFDVLLMCFSKIRSLLLLEFFICRVFFSQ